MASAPIKFSESDRSIEIAAGKSFDLELSSLPAAGHVWTLRRTPDIVRHSDDKYEPLSKNTGAAAKQTLQFEALKKGSGELELVYGTPWNQGVERSLVIQVRVV
jgi:predicted secreted protein